jgi:polyribonucleotide nucleotidyltransferase
VLSADTQNDTDVLAITGASAALALSEIPFHTTIAGVRVGFVDGEYVINPTYEQRKRARSIITVAGSKDGLVMVEAGAKEVSEEVVIKALEAGHEAIKKIVDVIDDLAKWLASRSSRWRKRKSATSSTARWKRRFTFRSARRCESAGRSKTTTASISCRRTDCLAPGRGSPAQGRGEAIFKELKEKVLREEVLERRVRLDGRKFDEIRPIWSQVSVLPRTHGSAVFTRGETQALVTCTLGTADDQQKIEHVEGETTSASCSTTTSRRSRSEKSHSCADPDDARVGHGALAERALTPGRSLREKFPYTIASSPTSSRATAVRRWPRCAADRCR